MSLLKAPRKLPKNATLQVRIDEELKTKLEKYAEFLDTTAAYVVAESLKLVFHKDWEFKAWLEGQEANALDSHAEHGLAKVGSEDCPSAFPVAITKPSGNGLFG